MLTAGYLKSGLQILCKAVSPGVRLFVLTFIPESVSDRRPFSGIFNSFAAQMLRRFGSLQIS